MSGQPKAAVRVTRTIEVPDEVRIERHARVPELGPRLLFFSGGSALRKLSRVLKRYTHNSVHLITPFDSGGSSASLRKAFGMLSVGDLRNRLMALADESVSGNPQIYRLFSHRMPKDGDPAVLARQLKAMVAGEEPLVAAIPEPLRRIVQTHLRHFATGMPPGFDLRGASIGNLILVGGYLANERDIDSVVYLFSKLVEVRGLVRPVVDAALHLSADYDDGEQLVGQHLITGKEVSPHDGTIRDLRLVDSLENSESAVARIDARTEELIRSADLICYPMGSFFTSVVANLLPEGVGRAIAEAPCPKVYVPSTGDDPEARGYSVEQCVSTLVRFVRRDAGADTPVERILNTVIADCREGRYPDGFDRGAVEALGVDVLDLPLVLQHRPELLDAQRLAQILLSLG
ncbi:MAG: GAK system CofD-like protein [Myxococcales bacterium]|jgi:CofD-related protein of GAK system